MDNALLNKAMSDRAVLMRQMTPSRSSFKKYEN